MTAAERAEGRKLILNDVKELVSLKKIKPTFQTYFEVFGVTQRMLSEAPYRSPLQDYIREPEFYCHVCAIGAVFMGYVDKFNKVDTRTYYISDEMKESVENYFTEEELELMEAAFEGFAHQYAHQLRRFQTYDNPTDRLLAIMDEMLKHDTLLPGEPAT